MINFILALLTLAAGALVGSAAALTTKKQLNIPAKIACWGGVLVLLIGAGIFGTWAEGYVHPHSLSKHLSASLVALIILYGCVCGVNIIEREEIEQALKDPGKKNWITVAAAKIWLTATPILWVIFVLLAPWDAYTSMAIAIGLGIVVATVMWLVFNFMWILQYGFNKKEIENPASS